MIPWSRDFMAVCRGKLSKHIRALSVGCEQYLVILSKFYPVRLNINRLLIGKKLLSAIYQGLALSELINLKTFVGILFGYEVSSSIRARKQRVCIILVTKVRDLTELTIRMLHCLANFY
jgi:hypothetical protein